MKSLKYLIFFFSLGLFLFTCTKEDLPELDGLPDASTVQFRVEQDYNVDPGGNTVILISETPQAVPIWDYGTGRSNRVRDTVRFAFKGDYTIKYSALTGGGVVEKPAVTIQVTEDNLNYVNDPLWTALSGGVGNEKTWYFDLDAEGVSKYWNGPMYFSGKDLGWEYSCLGDEALCWFWEADWPGNTWIGDAGDYGSMTFSLKGGPFVTVDHQFTTDRGLENGTYFLDVNTLMLTMTDAAPLQNSWADNDVDNWDNFRVISLNEDAMQLGAFHNSKDELVIFNFISKEYSDNWQPEETGDPVITVDLGGGTATDVISVSNSKTWSLSPETPFNWVDLEGTFLNNWESIDDYPDWAGFNTSHQADVASNSINFSSNGEVSLKYADGTEEEGTYTVNESDNTVTFEGVIPNFKMGEWATATTTAENQWKIVKTTITGGIVTDIWFGKRDPDKAEYMVFHFVLGSSSVDPLEAARKEITAALTGPDGTRSFRVSDTWHVDWLGADLSGGWTSETTFGDDFTSNNWVWTQEVKDSIQDPRLTFYLDGGKLFCTKTQDGETTTAEVTINPEENSITLDMDLIAFKGAASWLPTYGPTWYFCKSPLSEIETAGMWIGVPSPGKETEEVTAIHYVIAE